MMINSIFTDKLRFLDAMRGYADQWDWSKPMVVKIDELRRKEIQSRKFHAMCRDISKQIPWAGAMRNEKQWKHLLVSGHTYATEEGVEMVKGLEGELLNLRESTASMTIKRMASLIEYTHVWAASNGVVFSASAQDEDFYNGLPEGAK